MRTRRNGTARRVAASAVMTALGVVILGVGALFEVLDITMAVLASLLTTLAVIEFGGKYAYLIYAATSVLAVLLLPVKTPALLYALFAGYYPMFKALLERTCPRPLAWVFKVVLFNAALALAVFVAWRFFAVGVESLLGKRYWVLLVGTPVFVLYDVAMTRLITVYLFRWRRHFKFFHN